MTTNELKSRAYDLIFAIELRNEEINRIKQELLQVNQKINELNEKEKQANLKLAKDVVKGIPKVKG